MWIYKDLITGIMQILDIIKNIPKFFKITYNLGRAERPKGLPKKEVKIDYNELDNLVDKSGNISKENLKKYFKE